MNPVSDRNLVTYNLKNVTGWLLEKCALLLFKLAEAVLHVDRSVNVLCHYLLIIISPKLAVHCCLLCSPLHL